jgi:hypothetical protein
MKLMAILIDIRVSHKVRGIRGMDMDVGGGGEAYYIMCLICYVTYFN